MGIAIAGAFMVLIAIIIFAVIVISLIVNAIRHKKPKVGVPVAVAAALFVLGFILIVMSPVEIPEQETAAVTESAETKSEEPQAETKSETPTETNTDESETKAATAETESEQETQVPVSETETQTEESAAETEQAPTDESDSEIEEKIDTSVTFADIYRELKANELRAKDEFDGNRYQITGKVNGISTGGLFNLTGGATLTMENEVDGTTVFYTAEFEKEQEENLKQINEGDTITFIGTCSGGHFYDCELQ